MFGSLSRKGQAADDLGAFMRSEQRRVSKKPKPPPAAEAEESSEEEPEEEEEEEEEGEAYVLRERVPDDILGVLLGYFSDFVTFLNYAFICKSFRYYMTKINPSCCSHIRFKVFEDPPEAKPYVRRIVVMPRIAKVWPGRKGSVRDFIVEGCVPLTLRLFPNLEEMEVDSCIVCFRTLPPLGPILRSGSPRQYFEEIFVTPSASAEEGSEQPVPCRRPEIDGLKENNGYLKKITIIGTRRACFGLLLTDFEYGLMMHQTKWDGRVLREIRIRTGDRGRVEDQLQAAYFSPPPSSKSEWTYPILYPARITDSQLEGFRRKFSGGVKLTRVIKEIPKDPKKCCKYSLWIKGVGGEVLRQLAGQLEGLRVGLNGIVTESAFAVAFGQERKVKRGTQRLFGAESDEDDWSTDDSDSEGSKIKITKKQPKPKKIKIRVTIDYFPKPPVMVPFALRTFSFIGQMPGHYYSRSGSPSTPYVGQRNLLLGLEEFHFEAVPTVSSRSLIKFKCSELLRPRVREGEREGEEQEGELEVKKIKMKGFKIPDPLKGFGLPIPVVMDDADDAKKLFHPNLNLRKLYVAGGGSEMRIQGYGGYGLENYGERITTTDIFRHLSHFPNLVSLTVDSHSGTDESPVVLDSDVRTLTKLRELRLLGVNQFRGDAFSHLPRLVLVHVRCPTLVQGWLENLSSAASVGSEDKLRDLAVLDCRVSKAGLEGVAPSLVSFTLENQKGGDRSIPVGVLGVPFPKLLSLSIRQMAFPKRSKKWMLPRVRVLKLTKVESLTDNVFRRLPELLRMELVECEELTLECLKFKPFLRHLKIVKCPKIVCRRGSGEKPIRSLISLELRDNPNISEGIFRMFPRIERLSLGASDLIGKKPRGFCRLKRLTDLELFRSDITDEALKNCKYLETLKLNQSTKISGRSLHDLTYLRILDVYCCDTERGGFRDYSALPSLEWLESLSIFSVFEKPELSQKAKWTEKLKYFKVR